MSWWPGFSAVQGAWLFLLLIPLIIFYFLKLRRTRLEIASLALWRQVISDQRVNSPFQRFKRNLLLLFQIMLLCLLALAAMQPFLQGNAENAQYIPVLIDCSASMGAVDEETGLSRLDLVKEDVQEIIDGLLPGQQLTIIAVNSTARRLTEFTDNKPVLTAALDSIEVTDVPSRLEDGLQLAQALTRTFAIDTVRLYSDGNLPTRPDPSGQPMAAVDFDLSFNLDFYQIGDEVGNVGITAMNARRASVSRWDVFVRVESAKDRSSRAEVQLIANSQPLGAAETVVLGAGESQRLVFNVDARQAQFLEAQLTPDGHDALESDNVAYLNLPVGRDLLVYCAPSLATYRHSLARMEGMIVDPADDGATSLSAYDLVISDNLDDHVREASTYLFVGAIPEDLADLLSVEIGLAEVVDWKRDAPLLQHVQLKEVEVMDLVSRNEGVEDGDFEELGYELLAFGSDGPLIARKRDGPKLAYYFLFHTDRSTLPYRVAFPILVQNAVNIGLQQASLSELAAVRSGVLPPVSELTPGESYTVSLPDGSQISAKANEEGVLDGITAQHVGRYEVREGGEVVERFGVGLLNPDETSLLSVNEIQFKELSVEASEERLQTDKPLWPKLALAAFCVLLIEWWFFQRRPSGMP